jgi:transcriptional regulator with XRE-family HTH domain|nr:MAG TPA: DNA-binding transcriptional repressor [Caudoviricetes sp.]DAO94505.1 MAG TPA: DNA-binding transcriptional repressor [Caudoviricetes sp.]
MDKEIFVQNIKIYCALKGVKPTVACRESGVGTSFISDINRGQIPSVAKVQQLAQYLGCTVSDLLGETKAADQPAGSQDMFMELYKNLPPDRQLKAYLELLNLRGKE